jgi:hypothetical protein
MDQPSQNHGIIADFHHGRQPLRHVEYRGGMKGREK